MKEEARMNSRTSALLRKAASGYEPSAADKSRTRAAIGRRVAIGVAAGGAVAAGAKTAAAAPAALVPVATTAASVPAAAGVGAATGAGFAPAFTTAFASTFTGALTTKVIATVAILGTLSAGAVTVRHVAREHAKAASSVSATATAQQVQPTTSTTQAQMRATQTRTPQPESESVAATPINVAAAAAVDSPPVTAVTTIANRLQNKQNKPSSTTTIQSPALQTGAEVELIQRAQQALEAGDATAALVLLSEHARRFPNGALSEERDAARVLALCGAGQKDDAEQMGTAFLGRYPSSPLASRVRASCAGPSPSPHAGSNAITN